jgi:hypothetical protein
MVLHLAVWLRFWCTSTATSEDKFWNFGSGRSSPMVARICLQIRFAVVAHGSLSWRRRRIGELEINDGVDLLFAVPPGKLRPSFSGHRGRGEATKEAAGMRKGAGMRGLREERRRMTKGARMWWLLEGWSSGGRQRDVDDREEDRTRVDRGLGRKNIKDFFTKLPIPRLNMDGGSNIE